jgi:riboflavin kinase / FMN adenylyltransferase
VQVAQELAGFSLCRDSIITIGVFDGVHLGHKYLIKTLKELAAQQGLYPVIITFDKHPQEILNPESNPPFLTDPLEKKHLLKAEGVDQVILLPFNRGIADIEAEEFIRILISKLRMKSIVIGPDFALGKGARGNINAIRQLGDELNFSVTVVPPIKIDDEIISSTSIRTALSEGKVRKVRQFLGRPFSLHGHIVHGHGRGAGIVGFPTVNLKIRSGQALPGDGVYATTASIHNTVLPSVTNVGNNPTFQDKEKSIESYLIDFQANLYNQEFKIDFIEKLRDEIKFTSAEKLADQIIKDVNEARSILNIEAKDKK